MHSVANERLSVPVTTFAPVNLESTFLLVLLRHIYNGICDMEMRLGSKQIEANCIETPNIFLTQYLKYVLFRFILISFLFFWYS